MNRNGDAELALQVLEQVDHLRLDGHVERRHRLVGDHQLGLQRQRAGDADALPLAAGELAGVAVVVLGVEPDQLEQLLDPRQQSPSWRRRCAVRSGVAMIEPTVCRGFSEEYGSWKIICTSRRIGSICFDVSGARSRPSKFISPLVGSYSRVISRPVVDLPQPDSPTSPSASPALTEKLTPSTACT